MKLFTAGALAGLSVLLLAGGAEALPVAPAPTLTVAAPVIKTAVIITRRVMRPMRRVVVKRVVRRGPMGGRIVTTTRVVR